MRENETSKIKSIKSFFLSFLLTLSYLYLLSRSLNLIAENFDSRKTLIQGILLLIGWSGFFSSFDFIGSIDEKTKKDSRRMGRSFCIYRNRPFDFIKNDVFMKNKSGVASLTYIG